MVKGSVEEGVELGRVGGAVVGPTFCILKQDDRCSLFTPESQMPFVCMTSRVYPTFQMRNRGNASLRELSRKLAWSTDKNIQGEKLGFIF